MQDENRGTGRTTGLILKAIGNAILAKGEEVPLVDHYTHTHRHAHWLQLEAKSVAGVLGLKMEVRRNGNRVFVRSLFKHNAQ